jgi:DNA-binding LacI/PurR family transcriptional regulator
MPSAPTLKDIAALAGCSAMTVSLALRGSPRVGEARRREIVRLAERHGYRPNPLVSAWVAERGRRRKMAGVTLGLLTKFERPLRGGPRRPRYYSLLLSGMEARAEELGFRLEEFAVRVAGAPDGERLTRILRARGIRGLVLFPGGGFDPEFPALDWSHFAVVAAGSSTTRLPVHRTASDYALGMEKCLEEVERRGYRRPGLVMTARLDPPARYAFSGAFLAWQQRQAPERRVGLVPGNEPEPGEEAFFAWLRAERPDCVLTLNAPVEAWLKKRGVGPADGPGVVRLSLRGRRGVAGIDQRTAEVGRATVEVLAKLLYLNQSGLPETPAVTLIPGVWREGPTLRA